MNNIRKHLTANTTLCQRQRLDSICSQTVARHSACMLGATIKNKRAFQGYREYFRQFQGFRHRNTQ